MNGEGVKISTSQKSPIPAYRRFGQRRIDCARYDRLQNRLRSKRLESLLFCEHPPTVTAGLQSKDRDLLGSTDELASRHIALIAQKRGGGYTAHEPGQIVIYPHLDLAFRGMRISTLIQSILDTTTTALQSTWNLETTADRQAPGLYLENRRKIASIGLVVRNDFASYGIAINVDNDLRTFDSIVPCGHAELPVTSVVQEGGDPSRKDQFMMSWNQVFQQQLNLPPSHTH